MEKKEAAWNFYNNLLGTAGQRDLTLHLRAFHRPNADLSELDQTFFRRKYGVLSRACHLIKL
jgi:hypothetical protein